MGQVRINPKSADVYALHSDTLDVVKTFPTVAAINKHLGINGATMNDLLKTQRRNGNYRFCRATDYEYVKNLGIKYSRERVIRIYNYSPYTKYFVDTLNEDYGLDITKEFVEQYKDIDLMLDAIGGRRIRSIGKNRLKLRISNETNL